MNETGQNHKDDKKNLKRGWTTGACATAATKSALYALINGKFLDPVTIKLPGGQTPSFALSKNKLNKIYAKAAIIKDAGDDPDVTHGATIVVKITYAKKSEGIIFHAGKGVGTITKAGLKLDIGEAAINPAPRQMMIAEIEQICKRFNIAADFNIYISVPSGKKIAKKTWNERLGILGGISILGTSGIVIPYSCSAWINSIHSGIDVARANDIEHIIGATGNMSENAAKAYFNLPNLAYIDMGDFVGGLLKYARKNPVKRITIAGGFAKISKLAQGATDLHSKRSIVDFNMLANEIKLLGGDEIIIKKALNANTANEVLELSQKTNISLANSIANNAKFQAIKTLKNNNIKLDILIINKRGEIVAFTGDL